MLRAPAGPPGEVELRLLCAELHSHIFSEGVSAGMGAKKKEGEEERALFLL